MKVKPFHHLLLAMPAIFGLIVMAKAPAIASDLQAPNLQAASESNRPVANDMPTAVDATTLDTVGTLDVEGISATQQPEETDVNQLAQYSVEGQNTSIDQVTSVSQLSDVQPTDWAFQALQNLVERYGCIAGYPDGTYRGRQSTTRYEFAAGLNACLDRVNELIAAGLSDAVTRDDLATLQRLQEEFSAELAILRGQVDGLEARTAELEANQFSTTTTLSGRTVFLLSAPFEEDEQFDDQVIFGYRVRLNFDTSFTGSDRLRARLQARNIPRFAGDSVGLRASGDSGGNVQLDNLFYTFPVSDRLSLLIGANGLEPSEAVDNVISRFEDNDYGAISAFGRPTQYTQGTRSSGAGASFTYQLIKRESYALSISGGYIGFEPNNPSTGSGLFNGDYTTIGQLTYTSSFLDAAVTYLNAYSASAFSAGGVYDVDGPVVGNTYGGQVNFKFGTLQIGGGGAFTDVSGLGDRPDYDLWSYQGTLALNDFGGEGNQLGILAGVPPYTRDLPDQTRNTAFLAEVFYKFNLNDNIAITPSVIWLNDPYNDNSNSDTFIGSVRTTFRF